MQQLFNRWVTYLRAEKNASPYTIRNYTTDLVGNRKRGTEKGFFQFLKLQEVKSLDEVNRVIVRGYLAWLDKQGVKRRSIARKLSAVRSFFGYLQREELLKSNPVDLVSSPKLDRRLPSFLTAEETEKLIKTHDSCKTDSAHSRLPPDVYEAIGMRDLAMLELLYASGLRVSEMENLNLEHIDLDTGEVRVWGKGSKERMVLIGRPAVEAINRYLTRGRPKLLAQTDRRTNAVFLNRYGKRVPARRIQKILIGCANKTDINKNIHPHTLRHTFATHMLDGGADLRVVQELLGHSNLDTTQIYTHVSKAQAKKIYLAAHPMARQEGSQGDNPPANP